MLVEGSSLPATRTLAADFGINFHTVNKAYDLLRQQGLIRLNRKTGAVVTSTVADSPFHDGMDRAGHGPCWPKPSPKDLSVDEVLQACRSTLDSFGTPQPKDTP